MILHSPLAQSLIDQGFNPKPEWANGAKILTRDVRPEQLDIELCPRHVIVADEDEQIVMEFIEKIPYNRRPRIKPGFGRVAVPSRTSLLQDLSQSNDSEAWDSRPPSGNVSDEKSEANVAPLLSDTQDLPVRCTFIHCPAGPVTTPRTSQTI